ncbi:MAG: phosphoribosylaminoimidazolesuccinocarboxamide synthase [Methanophagales archaeon ANME-1-THS]|nr:MAG: phosphoribosylaminoimidazolesuccinocarboxamide synthase [Methanophagales archaeon ANME-1-THS]
MNEAKFIRSGKAKEIYQRPNGDIIFVFTDRVTAFDGLKKAEYQHKGAICCKLSCFWFEKLQAEGIPTHYKEYLPPNMLVAEEVSILPVEVIARNYLYGSLWKRYNAGELVIEDEVLGPGERSAGMPLTRSFLEFTTKFERIDRPVTDDEIIGSGWMAEGELAHVKEETIRIGAILRSYLIQRGIILADFKLEYGRSRRGDIVLADEVGTPDVCRFWDKDAYEQELNFISLDKDVFRQGKGDLSEVYREVCTRILG